MDNNLTSESTMMPEQAVQELNGAMAAGVEKAVAEGGGGKAGPKAGAGGGAKEDPFVDAFITSPISGLNILMAIRDGVTGGASAAKNKVESGFTHLGQNVKAHLPKPLVPMGYGEKTAALKRGLKAAGKSTAKAGGNIFERVQIAGQSLTGRVSGSKDAIAIKGANVAQAAKALGLGSFVAALDNALHQRDGLNRYDNNSKRLKEDLRQRRTPAKILADQKPEIAKNPT